MSIKTYILNGLNRHCVDEVRRGEVYDDGVNVPGPLAQRPKWHPLQISTQRILTAGAQSGGVPVLHLSHPTQTGAVLVSSLQVLPSGASVCCLGSGWHDKHRAILPFGPHLVLPVWFSCVSPPARLFLHRKHWNGGLLLISHLRTSLLSGQQAKWLICHFGINVLTTTFKLTVFIQVSMFMESHHNLSLGLPFRSSRSPLLPAFCFSLLPPLIDDHLTDVKSTLKTSRGKRDFQVRRSSKNRACVWWTVVLRYRSGPKGNVPHFSSFKGIGSFVWLSSIGRKELKHQMVYFFHCLWWRHGPSAGYDCAPRD